MRPWLVLLTLTACGGKAGTVAAYLTSDPCRSSADESSCLATAGCGWVSLGMPCEPGGVCPTGVCASHDRCAGYGDATTCAAQGCAWASADGLCPAGRECPSGGGFCHEQSDASGCVCACPLVCPEGADCPPCACDCDQGPNGPGGMCTCTCPACAPGEICEPCDCDCPPAPPPCRDGRTCTCDCPGPCPPNAECPACACDCPCTCECPACPPDATCPACECPCAGDHDRTLALDPSHPNYVRFEGIGFENACAHDGDCLASGCSREVCAAENVATTCEVVDTTAIDGASCGCVDATCGWFRRADDGPQCPCVCPVCITEPCPCACGPPVPVPL